LLVEVDDQSGETMQTLMRVVMIGGAVLVSACSNGPREGFDTIGAGAVPGVSGGLPGPASAAGSVSPTMTTDTTKRAAPSATAAKGDTTRRKP
jgi:hypothetical protein